MLNTIEIQKIIPHRYPFLFVDKIIELEEGKKIVGVKQVSFGEPFFQGHFPNYPIMPGVLIVEALAQTAAVLLSYKKDYSDKVILFLAIEKMRFRKPVFPGDELRLEVNVLRLGSKICQFEGKAYVGENLVTDGIFTAGIADKL